MLHEVLVTMYYWSSVRGIHCFNPLNIMGTEDARINWIITDSGNGLLFIRQEGKKHVSVQFDLKCTTNIKQIHFKMLSAQCWRFCLCLNVWYYKTSFLQGSYFFHEDQDRTIWSCDQIDRQKLMQGGLWLVNTFNVDLFHSIEMGDTKHIDWTSCCDVS